MKRIAIAGLQHETNTFSTVPTTLEAFLQADNWPSLSKGPEIFTNLKNLNIPISGFINEAKKQNDWQLIPILWASATPSGVVSASAFDTLCNEICQGLIAALPLDAVYLDLHGAMVTEQHEDAEGALLKKIRSCVGEKTCIVASLDLHANVSPSMVQLSDLLVAYRTYPHIDMADTGMRAANTLALLLDDRTPFKKAFHQFPFLITMISQSTLATPAKMIYEELEKIENECNVSASFCMGFPLSDVYDAGPSLMFYGHDETSVAKALEKLEKVISAYKNDFQTTLYSTEQAVKKAQQDFLIFNKKSILVDTQDNPGCGGAGDTVGLLREIMNADLDGVGFAMIFDPEVAHIAYQAGKGAHIHVALGGKTEGIEKPIEAEFLVMSTSDQPVMATGPFYRGSMIDIAPSAWLRFRGIDIIVASKNVQAADQSLFRHLGMDPSQFNFLALKSSVHYRADFDTLADQQLFVESPGANVANLKNINYQRLRNDINLF